MPTAEKWHCTNCGTKEDHPIRQICPNCGLRGYRYPVDTTVSSGLIQ